MSRSFCVVRHHSQGSGQISSGIPRMQPSLRHWYVPTHSSFQCPEFFSTCDDVSVCLSFEKLVSMFLGSYLFDFFTAILWWAVKAVGSVYRLESESLGKNHSKTQTFLRHFILNCLLSYLQFKQKIGNFIL